MDIEKKERNGRKWTLKSRNYKDNYVINIMHTLNMTVTQCIHQLFPPSKI